MKVAKTKPVIVKDIKVFQDFSMKKPYWEFMGRYDVEFIGDKARIHLVKVGVPDQKSRLNRVTKYGSVTDDNGKFTLFLYGMTVNGREAFFKSKHNIYS